DAVDPSTQLLDLDSAEAIDALIAGEIDVAMFASQLDTSFLQRALGARGLRLMNVAQAEAIAKTVPGLKHLVLSRGIISLTRDIPHEAHVCSGDRFANGLSVCSIVLLPLDVRLHVGRRHQAHRMPHCCELA